MKDEGVTDEKDERTKPRGEGGTARAAQAARVFSSLILHAFILRSRAGHAAIAPATTAITGSLTGPTCPLRLNQRATMITVRPTSAAL
jgi:hypothetical protein